MRSGNLHGLGSEIDSAKTEELLDRRKRLLTELFFLSKYAETPLEYGETDGASSAMVDAEDLAVFLAENDLVAGRIFREETLPQTRVIVPDATVQLQQDKNVMTDDDLVSTQPPRPSATNPDEHEAEALDDDSTSRDAEIAKASLLDAPSTNTDVMKTPCVTSLLVPPLPLATIKMKQAVVEPRRTSNTSAFDMSAWLLKARSKPLLELVHGARKTMSTSAWSAAIAEQKWIKVTERIEELKILNKWSLRQVVKEKMAPRRKTHWDFMLDEMTWLRTDFREERKWKIALARKIAYAVLEWHQSEDRFCLTIKTRPIAMLSAAEDVEMKDTLEVYEPPTPPSGSDDALIGRNIRTIDSAETRQSIREQAESLMVHSPPLSAVDDTTHVFEMPSDEIYAYLSDSIGRDSPSLLPDMPIYGPPMPDDDSLTDSIDSLPLVNVSKYTLSEVKVSLPKKRGRTDHEDVEASVKVHLDNSTFSQHVRRKSSQIPFTVRPPFVPLNIDRRAADRKDHQISWTSEADDMLLSLLIEYQYNWDFVSQAMTPTNPICAVADRKSPWDCFERWIQIDPRSSDVILTGAHAKLVQSRVDDMIRTPRTVDRSAVKRTSSSQKIQQNDLKKQRQFSLFDAMKKVQRKRENQPKAAQPKKTQADANRTAHDVPTPQNLSQMKYERDQQISRAFLDAKNQEMQQRRLVQQQQQKGGQPHTPAQIAQYQAARQNQVRAQLAQQAAQGPVGVVPNGSASMSQVGARTANGTPRPSLAGQMPPRPSSNGVASGGPGGMTVPVPNPAILRIPPGQKLNQEQMNQLLQQARLHKIRTASLSPGLPTNGHPLPNGTTHVTTIPNPAPIKSSEPSQSTPVSMALSTPYSSVSTKINAAMSPAPQSQTPRPNSKAPPSETMSPAPQSQTPKPTSKAPPLEKPKAPPSEKP